MRPGALFSVATLIAFCGLPAAAHVPYLEREDFTDERPFHITDIEQSLAVYAWLKQEDSRTDDVDVYVFTLTKPTRVYVQSLVPVRDRYEKFLPAFAVVGPGLPRPEGNMPFILPEGQGAIVVENLKPGEKRPTFYEFFGNKTYYRGPTFDRKLSEPGEYHVYFWDPHAHGGDYVAVFGYKESWNTADMLRALVNTPLIRKNLELHDEP